MEGRLPDISFGAMVSVMKEIPDERARVHAIAEMRMALADKIVKQKVKVIECEYHTVYRMEVFVLSPEELMKLVHDKAEEMVGMREYYKRMERAK